MQAYQPVAVVWLLIAPTARLDVNNREVSESARDSWLAVLRSALDVQ